MKRTKLIQILSSLSAWEFRSFLQFLQSPFFNSDQKLVQLGDFLYEIYPEFPESYLNRKTIFKQIMPGEVYHDQRFYDLTSELNQLLEKFLATRNFLHSAESMDAHLLKELRKKNIAKWLENYYRKKSLNGDLMYSAQDHKYQMDLDEVYLQHLSQKKQRKSERKVQQIVFHLDRWYLIQRLRYSCGLINRRELLGDTVDLAPMNHLSEYIGSQLSEFENSPELIGYFKIFRLLSDPEDYKYFERAWIYIRSAREDIPLDRQQEMYGYLMNYCIQRLNTGDQYFQKVLFEMYSWQLQHDLLIQEGWLSPWDFKNIVSLGIKMKRFEWTQTFIEKYQKSIAPHHRENAVRYNQATLYFTQNAFSKTLKLLQGIEFDDVYYELGAKTLLLKIYFETRDYETLFYLLDAFEAYLRRNRMKSLYQKDLYLNLIKLTRKLTRLKIKSDTSIQLVNPKQLEAFQRRVVQSPNVAQRDWLIKNLQELVRLHKTNSPKN